MFTLGPKQFELSFGTGRQVTEEKKKTMTKRK